MITIYKGYSANTIVATLTERLNLYNISEQTQFYFSLYNEVNRNNFSFPLTDISSATYRFNAFLLDENNYNFPTDTYNYSVYADSGQTQILEVGRLVVSGSNSYNAVYL